MSAKNGAPVPQPKPWLRKSNEIIAQAQEMMTVSDEPVVLAEEDPE